MIIDGNHIIADNGKLLRRIVNKEVVGKDYWLGYLYYLNGELLPEPILEAPADFEEPTIEQVKEENTKLYPLLVDKYIRELYSISDELAINRQRDTKPDAFREYFDFCEECKVRAREELNL